MLGKIVGCTQCDRGMSIDHKHALHRAAIDKVPHSLLESAKHPSARIASTGPVPLEILATIPVFATPV